MNGFFSAHDHAGGDLVYYSVENAMRPVKLFLPAALLLAVLMIACGSSDSDNAGVTEISQALAAAEGSETSASGFLIADRDGLVRLCSQLLESFPPQCGGDRIDLPGFDASSVPGTQRAQVTNDIQTLIWTNDPISITGIRTSEGLGSARLLPGD